MAKRAPMSQPPDHIWLQWDGEGWQDYNPPEHSDVTWAAHAIFTGDVQYVRADLFNDARAEATSLRQELSQINSELLTCLEDQAGGHFVGGLADDVGFSCKPALDSQDAVVEETV